MIYTRLTPATFAHRPIEIAVMYDGYSVSVDGQYCGSLHHSPPQYKGAPFRARRIIMLPHGLDAVREPNDFTLRCFQVMDSTYPLPAVFIAPRTTLHDAETANILVAHADVPISNAAFMKLLYENFPDDTGMRGIRVKAMGEMFLEFVSAEAARASLDRVSGEYSLDVCHARAVKRG